MTDGDISPSFERRRSCHLQRRPHFVLEVTRTEKEKEYVAPMYDILVLHYGSATGLGTITGTIVEFWERIC